MRKGAAGLFVFGFLMLGTVARAQYSTGITLSCSRSVTSATAAVKLFVSGGGSFFSCSAQPMCGTDSGMRSDQVTCVTDFKPTGYSADITGSSASGPIDCNVTDDVGTAASCDGRNVKLRVANPRRVR